MSSYFKLARLFPLFLLLSLPMFGQYTYTPSYSWTSNIPWCGSHNCLTSIGGVTDETKVGVDGTIRALSGPTLWQYVAGQWSTLPTGMQTPGGHNITHVSVGSASHILVLTNATSNNVYILNSAGNGWVAVAGNGYCTLAEIGADGDIWCLNVTSIFHFNGISWTSIAGGLRTISVGSVRQIWGVNVNGQLYQWNGSGWTTVAVSGFTPAHGSDALAVADIEDALLLLLDTSGGIHLSMDGGSDWSVISGTAASVTGGGGPFLFTRSSGGVSYHVNTVVLQTTLTANGTWSCPPAGCPAGSFHTLTATAKWGGVGGAHGTTGVTAQTQGYPQNYLNTIAQEPASNCDIFFGNPGTDECIDWLTGAAQCSQMGALPGFAGGGGSSVPPAPPWINFEIAITGGKYATGTAQSQMTFKGVRVACGANTSCTAATTPPRCKMPSPVWVVPEVGESPEQECVAHAGWIVAQPAVKIAGFWICAGDLGPIVADPTVSVTPLGAAANTLLPLACTTP